MIWLRKAGIILCVGVGIGTFASCQAGKCKRAFKKILECCGCVSSTVVVETEYVDPYWASHSSAPLPPGTVRSPPARSITLDYGSTDAPNNHVSPPKWQKVLIDLESLGMQECPICLESAEDERVLQGYVVQRIEECRHWVHVHCLAVLRERRKDGECPRCTLNEVNRAIELFALGPGPDKSPLCIEKVRVEV